MKSHKSSRSADGARSKTLGKLKTVGQKKKTSGIEGGSIEVSTKLGKQDLRAS